MATESFVIRTPASSANIGPGFDVIGLALSLYLELHVTIDRSKASSTAPLNCRITYEGDGEDSVPLDPDANLVTRVALYVLRCHNQRSFPVETHVHIKNPIPLGRGLGSSGAAVVAGVMLGKEVGGLHHLTPARLFDFCLMIERHPDNVGAALFGGFVGTYLNRLKPEDVARKEIPLSEVLPAPAGGVDTGDQPPAPPLGIGHHIKFPWSPTIKAVAIIPEFEVATAKAREVLPAVYPRADVVSRPNVASEVRRQARELSEVRRKPRESSESETIETSKRGSIERSEERRELSAARAKRGKKNANNMHRPSTCSG